jgi:hypothetical protein
MRNNKTAPQNREHPKTSSPMQPGLIVKANNERQSARTECALDNHFHRTAFMSRLSAHYNDFTTSRIQPYR